MDRPWQGQFPVNQQIGAARHQSACSGRRYLSAFAGKGMRARQPAIDGYRLAVDIGGIVAGEE